MSLHTRPSGELILICDRPGCLEYVEAESTHPRDAVRAAERAGWQISPHADIPVDLCPRHYEPSRAHSNLTRLYDENWRAVAGGKR